MSRVWIFLSLLTAVVATYPQPRRDYPSAGTVVCNVRDFGAKGTGVDYDTKALQSAVDTCSAKGKGVGSTVLFPAPGIYLTATILIKSDVTIFIDKGAEILMGARREDYGATQSVWYNLLFWNATNVGLAGEGMFNGNSDAFTVRFDPIENVMINWADNTSCSGPQCRPRAIGFLNCTDVSITGITIFHTNFWTLHLVGSDHVVVDRINITGDFLTPQSDGIDIHNSQHVQITNSWINTADDSICPKTNTGAWYGSMGPTGTHDVVVRNVTIRSKSSAIKFGSSTYLNFSNLLFDNITIWESHRGLAVQLRDGGNVTNVTFSNIKVQTQNYGEIWWGAGEPIYLTSVPRHPSTVPAQALGHAFDITFENITAIGESGVLMAGWEGHPIEGITMRNVNVTVARWSEWPGGFQDYRPGGLDLVEHKTNVLYMADTKDVTIKDSVFAWGDGRGTEANFWGETISTKAGSVSNLVLDNVQFTNP